MGGFRSVVVPLALILTLTQTSLALAEQIRFSAIGDYGDGSALETAVANLVKGWGPDFIITTGDNNYPKGEEETIDENIGRDYHTYIQGYAGDYGQGSSDQKFYPSLGNHDWDCKKCNKYPKHYLKFFNFPKNKLYYEFVRGPVHFFALDSDSREPDGISENSEQAKWLKKQLAKSTSRFNIVFFHHAPYVSGGHGPAKRLRWPFKQWGVDAVLTGHDHLYERIIVDDLPYFVNGSGGAELTQEYVEKPAQGSKIRYNKMNGAMLITADEKSATFEFYNVKGEQIDRYVITSTHKH